MAFIICCLIMKWASYNIFIGFVNFYKLEISWLKETFAPFLIINLWRQFFRRRYKTYTAWQIINDQRELLRKIKKKIIINQSGPTKKNHLNIIVWFNKFKQMLPLSFENMSIDQIIIWQTTKLPLRLDYPKGPSITHTHIYIS